MSIPISFEVYPPRRPDLQPALHETIRQLAQVNPRFITVTYGANGSSRDASLDCLRFIREQTTIEPLAHLTCVGSTHHDMVELIREFVGAGISSFLALRGDPPQGAEPGEDFLGDLKSATELVALLREECGPEAFIAVAAFPNGHPQSSSAEQDVAVLQAKQRAGADMAITQLFFEARDYLDFASLASRSGVLMPILPGIMPVTSFKRLQRIVEITGERMPERLAEDLSSAPTPERAREIGIQHVVALCRDLIDGGAPGLHLYAFNEHETVLELLGHLRLV